MQCAYWFLTINPNAECYSSINDILNNLLSTNKDFKFSYIVHTYKENDDTFNENHVHLVLYFGKKVKRFDTLLSLFKGAHIEFTNRNRYVRCLQYLIHKNDKDKFQYSINDIITNYNYEELIQLLDSIGYEFEFFDVSKITDYIVECFNILTIDSDKKSDYYVYMFYFINRFGLEAIKPYYFVIKDLLISYKV